MERDELVEENERSAARLDQLTTDLQEQREGKARLANQVTWWKKYIRRISHRTVLRKNMEPFLGKIWNYNWPVGHTLTYVRAVSGR